jgi:hypothetical protein
MFAIWFLGRFTNQKEVHDMNENHPLKRLLISCLSLDAKERITAPDIVQQFGQEDFINGKNKFNLIKHSLRTAQ